MNEDRASRYHRLKRQTGVAGVVWRIVLLALLLISAASVSMRHVAEAISVRLVSIAWQPPLTVFFYVVLLSAVNETGSLPLNFYSGYILEHRYELSTETVRGWLFDQLKAFSLGTLLSCGAAGVIYWFIRHSPDWWWLWAGCAFAVLIIVLTNLAPVLLLPLFYSVKPIDRDGLRHRLLTLAERAGARVVGAYEMGFAGKTRKANAALAGIGTTRRILVSDTMLAEYSDDEIEVVLAHEMAHHVHGDIWKGIVFESALILAGFYLSARVLEEFASAAGLNGVDDPAGLPLLLLAAGAVTVVMMPVGHAISRTFERSADRFALRLTQNPSAFVSAMRRLAAQNLAEDQPSKVVQWLFYSHPPIRERIAAAEAFDT